MPGNPPTHIKEAAKPKKGRPIHEINSTFQLPFFSPLPGLCSFFYRRYLGASERMANINQLQRWLGFLVALFLFLAMLIQRFAECPFKSETAQQEQVFSFDLPSLDLGPACGVAGAIARIVL